MFAPLILDRHPVTAFLFYFFFFKLGNDLFASPIFCIFAFVQACTSKGITFWDFFFFSLFPSRSSDVEVVKFCKDFMRRVFNRGLNCFTGGSHSRSRT